MSKDSVTDNFEIKVTVNIGDFVQKVTVTGAAEYFPDSDGMGIIETETNIVYSVRELMDVFESEVKDQLWHPVRDIMKERHKKNG